MVKNIVFASSNAHKTAEIRSLLQQQYNVLNLLDIGCLTEIPETGATFEENALQKSSFVVTHYQMDCFADDSGLEVLALNNEPGVFSARYSGTRDDHKNLHLLLKKMEGIADRRARFVTVISLISGGKNYFFKGSVRGTIAYEPTGIGGFGYDPIFVPEGHTKTFAELAAAEKNAISHRAIAVANMVAHLKAAI